MNWYYAVPKHHQALSRIAAMLVALAVLAERAAGCPLPIRCLVLSLLRPAEEAARTHVAEAGRVSAPLMIIPNAAPRAGDSPDDALRLAQTFRLLAAAFNALSVQDLRWPSGARRQNRDCLSRRLPALPCCVCAAPRPGYADTS